MFLASQDTRNKSLGLEFSQVTYDQFLEDPEEERQVLQNAEYPLTTFCLSYFPFKLNSLYQ